MFINPLDTFLNIGKSAASAGMSAGFNKLREHFHLTDKDLKEYVTVQNTVYATLAAGGVAALMINPITRVVLCTFLSMSITMSTIVLNLMMVGLYATWMGMKGLGSLAAAGATIAPVVSGIGKNVLEGVVNSGKTTPANPLNSVVDELVPRGPSAPTVTQPLETTPSGIDLDQHKVIQPEDGSSEYENLSKETDDVSVAHDEKTDANQLLQDTSLTTMTEQQLEELYLEGLGIPSTPQVSNTLGPDFDNYLKEYEEYGKASKKLEKAPNIATSTGWIDEFTNTKKHGVSLSIKEFAEFQKQAPLNPVQMLRSQSIGEEWASDFLKQQTTTPLAKYAAGAFAVGLGAFTVYKLYQTLRNQEKTEEEDTGVTYASIASEALDEINDDDRLPELDLDYDLFSN